MGNGVSTREGIGEHIRMLEPELEASKLDVSIIENEAVQNEVGITKSLEKLYVTEINAADTLVQMRATRVVRNVAKSCREIQPIHGLSTKLLSVWK